MGDQSGKAPKAAVPLFMTLQLKVDSKARGNFVKIWSSEQLIEEVDCLECIHAAANNFPGRTANWNSDFSNPILRADRLASGCATLERAATLRLDGTLPARDHSASAPARLHID